MSSSRLTKKKAGSELEEDDNVSTRSMSPAWKNSRSDPSFAKGNTPKNGKKGGTPKNTGRRRQRTPRSLSKLYSRKQNIANSFDYRNPQNLRKWTAALRASAWRGAPRKQEAPKNRRKRQLPALWRMRKQAWRPRKWAVNLLLRYDSSDNSTTRLSWALQSI